MRGSECAYTIACGEEGGISGEGGMSSIVDITREEGVREGTHTRPANRERDARERLRRERNF